MIYQIRIGEKNAQSEDLAETVNSQRTDRHYQDETGRPWLACKNSELERKFAGSTERKGRGTDEDSIMKRHFEINQIRYTIKQNAGRKITEKVIPCLYCPNLIECTHKKLKTGTWKQWVPVKQYCNIPNCAKKSISFRTNLAKKLLQPKNESQYLTAQYCLWKMITRTPIEYLIPILSNNFEHARPISITELEQLVN